MNNELIDVVSKNVIHEVYRLRFLRALKTLHSVGSVCSCDLIICSEFNDQIVNLKSDLFSAPLAVHYQRQSDCGCGEEPSMPLSAVAKHYSDGKIRVKFPFPNVPGQYYFIFSLPHVHKTNNKRIMFLSLVTDIVNVHPENISSISLPLLSNYRWLSFEQVKLSIKEEYGSTIGAHLYDSAIVAIKFCQSDIFVAPMAKDVVLELGAGCGLTGLWFAKQFGCKVLLTDQPCQIPLLQSNITVNQLSNFCQSMVFDWSECIEKLGSNVLNNLKIVIATDVLYDSIAAETLLILVRSILMRSTAVVLFAQKNRANQTIEEARSTLINLMPLLQYRCLRFEANVFVWKIVASSRSDR